MPVLTLGLFAGVAACAYVGYASWSAGYTPEVAVLRGVLAFMAVTFLAYLGELTIATAPPRRAAAPDTLIEHHPASDGDPDMENDSAVEAPRAA